jgi:hypothetical protein
MGMLTDMMILDLFEEQERQKRKKGKIKKRKPILKFIVIYAGISFLLTFLDIIP